MQLIIINNEIAVFNFYILISAVDLWMRFLLHWILYDFAMGQQIIPFYGGEWHAWLQWLFHAELNCAQMRFWFRWMWMWWNLMEFYAL